MRHYDIQIVQRKKSLFNFMFSDKRFILIIVISLLVTSILFSFSPIKQDNSYHLFADSRVLFRLPNFLNVVTNLPFLIVGFIGIRLTSSAKLKPQDKPIKIIYLVFFVGILLTCLGSSYYHYSPDNSTLVWDRLPMTISFMAFFCVVVGKCVSARAGLILLGPLLTLGIISLIYWNSYDDLRPYILVQFLPILLIPVILWLYKGNQKNCNFVWLVLGFYLLSKIAESQDSIIYQHLHFISGHSLKHLIAGLATYIVYASLKPKRTIE
jgi:Ceramidase